MDESGTCATCGFCRANKELKLACHRYPPTIVVVAYTPQGAAWQSHFPLVDRGWSCGEYETKLAVVRQ